jgi:hypothetical protein
MNRLLVVARDFNAAKHWARENKISTGQWVYVSSFYNVQGNPGSDYIKIPGHELRPDISVIDEQLKKSECTEFKN